MNNHSFEYVILGGGVAGLCAAKRLLELGIQPLVIEGGNYPSHKVCGEFISPSSLSILSKWDIHPLPIHEIQWSTPSHTLKIPLRKPAGSLSHISLDPELADQIRKQSALLWTEKKVTKITPACSEGFWHHLELSCGKNIRAKHLLIATGRLPNVLGKNHSPKYMGIKSHFSGLNLKSVLTMFSFPGAYLGIVPVENEKYNLACLAKIGWVEKFPSLKDFMSNLLRLHPSLTEIMSEGSMLFENWMEAKIPEFGNRSTPHWHQTYWIGDAAQTIPPASGNGLSLAIASGYFAAEFAARNQPMQFKEFWRKRCAQPMFFGKGLHHLFLNSTWSSLAMGLNSFLPSLSTKIFEWSRNRD